jgi:hypothetical protein
MNKASCSMAGKLELGRQESRFELEDDDRANIIMQYLLAKASKSCFDTKKKKELKCTCLSCLDDHSLRNSIALWTLQFA